MSKQVKPDVKETLIQNKEDKPSYKWDKTRGDFKCYEKKNTNHPNWRSNNPQLEKEVAGLPTWQPIGYSNLLVNPNYESLVQMETNFVPGIMTFEVLQVFGEASDWNSALNVVGRDLGVAIMKRAGYNGAYEYTDLVKHIAQGASLMSNYEFIKSIFGCLHLVKAESAYIKPEALITCSGIDFGDLSSSINNTRSKFNTVIRTCGQIMAPAGFPILDRFRWIFQNFYADTTMGTAQLYRFVPSGFYLLNHKTGNLEFKTRDQIAELTGYTKTEAGYPLSMFIDFLSMQISAITGDSNYLAMTKDFGRTFPTQIFQPEEVPENYTINPIYDDAVLVEIENMDIAFNCSFETGIITNECVLDLVEIQNETYNAPELHQKLQFNITGANNLFDPVVQDHKQAVNFHVAPTAERFMYATAFKHVATFNHNGSWGDKMTVHLDHTGSEVILNAQIWCYSQKIREGQTALHANRVRGLYFPAEVDPSATAAKPSSFDYNTFIMVDDFQQHPRVPVFSTTDVGIIGDKVAAGYLLRELWDRDLYITFDRHQFDLIQKYATQSLWGYPFKIEGTN